VDVSVKSNFVRYHVENNDTEVSVINDFNTVSVEYDQLQFRSNSIKLF